MINEENRYQEALERARKELNACGSQNCDAARQIFRLFPELKESNDERIRKSIIGFLITISSLKDGKTVSNKDFDSKAILEWVTWLEKQSEQKPTDKVEPKFKVGDWCIDNEDNIIFQITKVLSNSNLYYCRTNEGKAYSWARVSIECDAHLWTIQDAKDGDVLVYGDNPDDHHVEIIMIFKSLRNEKSAFTYFHIFDDSFKTNDWCDCGKNAHPATKEQRDFLFQKMYEAGYEWDLVKKELKKIEQTFTWSKEDEKKIMWLVRLISTAGFRELDSDKMPCSRSELLDWLKSLKERMK